MSDVTRLIARAREIAPFSEDEQLLFDLARELEKAQPRIIKTAEELDALPDGVVIRSEFGIPLEKCIESPDCSYWCAPESENHYAAKHIALPATVLFDPKEETK